MTIPVYPGPETRYFVSPIAPVLFRRGAAHPDEVFNRDGVWVPTDRIALYMSGEVFELDPITEAQARAAFPHAF